MHRLSTQLLMQHLFPSPAFCCAILAAKQPLAAACPTCGQSSGGRGSSHWPRFIMTCLVVSSASSRPRLEQSGKAAETEGHAAAGSNVKDTPASRLLALINLPAIAMCRPIMLVHKLE